MKNIFIILSKSHLNTINQIINEYELENVTIIDQYNYIDESKHSIINSENFDIHIRENMHLTFYQSILNQINKCKFVMKIGKTISLDNSVLYVPHMGDIITNALYNYDLNTKPLLSIYEDGILLYYKHRLSNMERINSLLKLVITKIYGLNYLSNHKSYLAYEEISSLYHIYLRYPECYSFGNIEKLKRLSINKIDYLPTDSVSLILGQEAYIIKYGVEEYIRGLNYLEKSIHKHVKVYYKPHRLSNNDDLDLILKKSDIDLLLFKDDNPIEDVIGDIKPTNIYSFSSSALLNLKFAITCKVNIYSCEYFSNTMSSIFQSIGINIIKK